MKRPGRHWFPVLTGLLLAVIAFNLLTLYQARPEAPAAAQDRAQSPQGPAPKGRDPVQAQKKQEKKAPEDPHKGHQHGDEGGKPGGMMGHMKGHMGMMPGMGMKGHPRGMMGMMGNPADMMDIRLLLMNHQAVKRTVKELPNGVETVTTSADKDVAAKLQGHVKAMYARLKEKRPIRPMDPLFAALFENADKIDLVITNLPDGVRVRETSRDAYAVKLIRAHAEAVNRFVQEGMPAMMKMTPAPKKDVP